eukprot:CAMPEP_0172163202 /NCGR_PEP_ID=MMETSP1050-20130122/7137_1 /TAXON_ID=233186 /ORGANISM="Cryptomonas curvata, Strain CCAP979/52" /LENGTH=144 /DNA_ID=CAMNT_0012833359 /DNA_START=45 /DNA_END=476 /DNA_ORIENTATION=-
MALIAAVSSLSLSSAMEARAHEIGMANSNIRPRLSRANSVANMGEFDHGPASAHLRTSSSGLAFKAPDLTWLPSIFVALSTAFRPLFLALPLPSAIVWQGGRITRVASNFTSEFSEFTRIVDVRASEFTRIMFGMLVLASLQVW